MKRTIKFCLFCYLACILCSCEETLPPPQPAIVESPGIGAKHKPTLAEQWDTLQVTEETVFLNDQALVAQYKLCRFFCLLTENRDTIVPAQGYYAYIDFKDINGDRSDDLSVAVNTNGGNNCETYFFDQHTQDFQHIDGADEFFERVTGSKFYFSYHRAGCADMNWVSTLFKIENFRKVNLALMKGYDCEEARDGVYIFRIDRGREHPFQSFPGKTFEIETKNNKWDYMRRYWERNHARF